MTPPNITGSEWTVDDGLMGQQDHIDRLTEDLSNPDRHWVAVGISDEDGFAESVAYCHPENAKFIAAAPAMSKALNKLLTVAVKRHSKLSYNEPKLQSEGEWGDDEQDELEQLRAQISEASEALTAAGYTP